MIEASITDQEFALFQRLIYKIAGISLGDSKKILLVGRLTRRLKVYECWPPAITRKNCKRWSIC